MKKILDESKHFRMTRETKKGTGKKFYRITWYNWRGIEFEDEERMRDIVDPFRNRSGKHGSSWKFTNKEACKEAYITLVLSFT